MESTVLDVIVSTTKQLQNLLFFHFFYLYLFLAGNSIVYTPTQGTNTEMYSLHYHIKVKNADSGRKKKQFFHPSLPL